MKTLIVRFFLVSLCTALPAVAVFSQTYKLEYKLGKGKTYRYNTVTSGDMTQEMMGQEMKMSQSTHTTVRIMVDAVSKGNMDLLISADSAISQSKSAMRDTTMVLRDLIGKRTKITLSNSGQVLSRTIVDTIQAGAQMRGQREWMNFFHLPAKAVAMNEQWKTSNVDTIESMGGRMISTTQLDFVLVGKENKLGHDCLKMTYSGKSAINGNAKMMGMELFMEGTGKVTGTFYFDASVGVPVLTESTTDTEMTMAATGQQQMTIPMSQSMKSTSALIRE